jgi:hypothetical protein
MTLQDRCKLATDCLPDAEYRVMLTALHKELLDEIGRLKAACDKFSEAEMLMKGALKCQN